MVKVAIHFALELDFAVYSPDAIGHGRSTGAFGTVYSICDMVATFGSVVNQGHDAYPHLPIFFQGASLGGLIVLWAASMDYLSLETYSKLRGVISVCPALTVHEKAGNKLLLEFVKLLPCEVLKHVFPKLPTTQGPRGVSFPTDSELRRLAEEESDADPL